MTAVQVVTPHLLGPFSFFCGVTTLRDTPLPRRRAVHFGVMPGAEIASKQAVYTLGLLHAELAGKLLANKREAIRLEKK